MFQPFFLNYKKRENSNKYLCVLYLSYNYFLYNKNYKYLLNFKFIDLGLF